MARHSTSRAETGKVSARERRERESIAASLSASLLATLGRGGGSSGGSDSGGDEGGEENGATLGGGTERGRGDGSASGGSGTPASATANFENKNRLPSTREKKEAAAGTVEESACVLSRQGIYIYQILYPKYFVSHHYFVSLFPVSFLSSLFRFQHLLVRVT